MNILVFMIISLIFVYAGVVFGLAEKLSDYNLRLPLLIMLIFPFLILYIELSVIWQTWREGSKLHALGFALIFPFFLPKSTTILIVTLMEKVNEEFYTVPPELQNKKIIAMKKNNSTSTPKIKVKGSLKSIIAIFKENNNFKDIAFR